MPVGVAGQTLSRPIFCYLLSCGIIARLAFAFEKLQVYQKAITFADQLSR
jgi:hypothetical protein